MDDVEDKFQTYFKQDSYPTKSPVVPMETEKAAEDRNVTDANGSYQECCRDVPGSSTDVTLKAAEKTDGQDRKEDPPKDNRQSQKKGKKWQNPFMPQKAVMRKVVQERTEKHPKATNVDQIHVEVSRDQMTEKVNEDVDGLMEWWGTVEHWNDMPMQADLSEKEKTKAFAVTAERVMKGIRVFNKLFTEWAEGLWQHVIDLNAIADGIDRFNKRAKIAAITGGSTSAVGGVTTIAGLALAPVTLGTSLIVTAVGLGVATAGGLTSASAGISNSVNNSLDRKKVERIVADYQAKMADISKCLKFIKQGIDSFRKYDAVKIKEHGCSQEIPELSSIYKEGAMAGKAVACNAAEIMRVTQAANVAGSTATRAIQLASMATGVLTGLFVAMDIYFVAKDSCELKKGAKSEFAAKIRDVAEQLHSGLVELNGIRAQLQEFNVSEEPGIRRDLFSPASWNVCTPRNPYFTY
uniref:Apolipoprotein L, 1 n=1 Tax=Paramormyrops kingsleyae TaxID=1676925 RepID=A0A3B3S505_9TELE